MNAIAAAFGSLVDETAELVEPLRAKRQRRPRYMLVERGGDYELYRNDRGGPAAVAQGRLSELSQAKLPRKAVSQPIELRLDAGRVLSRTLQLPIASRQYLDAIVGHQVERMTPWTADRVVFDYVVDEAASTSDHVAVRLVATSRDMLDGVTERLAGARIKAAVVGTSEDPLDQASPVNLLEGSKAGRRQAFRRAVGFVLVCIMAVGVLLSAFSGWRLYTANAEAAAVQRDLDAARAAVEAARSRTVSSESYARMLARKQGAVAMVVLIDQLSEIIPKDTYLTELQVEDQNLRITGFSDNAPALIGIIEGAEGLADARFAAPTTRDEGTTLDRFEIVARLEPPPARAT